METDSYTGGRPFETSFEIGRALGHGFRALRRCLPILWVGGCIRACTSGGGGGGGGGGAEEHEREGARQVLDHAFGGLGLGSHLPVASIGGMEAAIVIVLAVVVLFVVAFAFAIQAWFVPGWLRVHEEIARTGEAQWGTLFGTLEPFGRMFRWVLLKAVIAVGVGMVVMGPVLLPLIVKGEESPAVAVGAGVSVLLAIPAVWVWLGMALGDHVVTFEGANAMEALDRSLELARGHRFHLLLFYIVVGLVSAVFALLGACAFLIGLVVTVPLSSALLDFAVTESYLLRTRKQEETDAWSIWQWAA